jgi:transcriptional regulator with XRE-family HTH domain
VTVEHTDEYDPLDEQRPARNFRRIAALRIERGWTQEELAEHSGLSVRTIRNLELGRVQNPRRSSVDLLVNALGVTQERSPGAEGRGRTRWRGLQPPNSALVGPASSHEHLAHTVRANRLTSFLGPGGVGKTRVSLSVAMQVGHSFRHGVAVVELGEIPPELHSGQEQTAPILQRVRAALSHGSGTHQAAATRPGPDAELEMLLLLDHAEHVPAGVMAATRELLATLPGIHILITTRRRLTERLGANREIQPLPAEAAPGTPLSCAPAVELFLRHFGAPLRTATELENDLPLIAELCRRLGGLPRYIEFAAECLRTIPIRLLLSYGPTPEMLESNDQALLRHQRSVTESILWSMSLLSGAHRLIMDQIAASASPEISLDQITADYGRRGRDSGPNPLILVSDLLDSSLLLPSRINDYHYRLAPFVAEVLRRRMPAERRSAELRTGLLRTDGLIFGN